jgi:hypothetical protein
MHAKNAYHVHFKGFLMAMAVPEGALVVHKSQKTSEMSWREVKFVKNSKKGRQAYCISKNHIL